VIRPTRAEVLLGAAAVWLAVSGVWAGAGVLELDTGICRIPQPAIGPPWNVAFAVAALAAFGLGGWSSRWRAEGPAPAPPSEGHQRRQAWAVQLFLVAGFALTTAFLGYEAWAIYASPPRSPITDFVRCASHVGTAPTLFAAVAILFLAGHWLWHPGGSRQPAEPEGAAS
jgi:hypothetical protein